MTRTVLWTILVMACANGTSANPASNNGAGDNSRGSATGYLEGQVTIGPNCPVERVGVPCPPSAAAYAARHLAVYSASHALVQTISLDTTGHYRAALAAGRYTVDLAEKSGVGGARSLPATVDIQAGETTVLDVSIDTGIR